MSYYIYDIDGTISDSSHRAHFVRPPAGKKKDWKSFFADEHMLKDPPHEAVINILRTFHSLGTLPVYCTGRPSSLRDPTLKWIQMHAEPETYLDIEDRLFMRAHDDHRDDSIVKPELVARIIEVYGPPLAMFEDRTRVVEAVRSMGVTVFQVADGNF